MKNYMYTVNGSKYAIELLPDRSVIIWDTELEEALVDYVDRGNPLAPHPPSPIVASGLTETEAHDWLMEKLHPEYPCLPVTRVQ